MIKGLNEIIMPIQEVDDSLHNAFGINEIAFEVRHDIEELIVELGMTCFELVKVAESITQVWWPTLMLGGLKRHWKWIFRSSFDHAFHAEFTARTNPHGSQRCSVLV